MAVGMNGEVYLAADRPTVWANLNDLDVLKASIPGCDSMEWTSPTTFSALAKFKLGPLKVKLKAQVTLSNIVPLHGVRISGEGQGGLAGFAGGYADVRLFDAEDGGTVLSYTVHGEFGGALAKIGGSLVDGLAKRTLDGFFARFAASLKPVA